MGGLSAPIYKALDPDDLQIRLLHLEPGGGSDQVITCRMITASLSKNLQYNALSYVWGDPTPTDEIMLNDSPFRVANNLAGALKHLRTTKLFGDETALPIWIDAICINQADLAERSQYVALMGTIYSGASRVLSWLGEPDRSSRYTLDVWTRDKGDVPMTHGFPLIRAVSMYIDSRREDGTLGWNDDTVLTAQDFQWMAHNPDFYASDMEGLSTNSKWNAIVKINFATYWTRIWIVQEMVLASSPRRHLIFCGAEYVTYHQLNDLHDFVQKVHDQRPARPSFVPQQLWWTLSERSSMELTIIYIINYMKKVASDSTARVVPFLAWDCSCTEPRDHIYGLLAVVANSIEPDYSKPVAQVYQDWFADSLRRGRYVNIMAWSGIGHGFANSHGIPSWLPVLHEFSKKKFSSRMIRDFREDDIDPWLDSLQLGPPRIRGDGLLGIHGVLLDTASDIDFPLHEEPTIEERFAKFCKDVCVRYNGRRYRTGQLLLEAVLSVLFQGFDSIKKQKLDLLLEPTNLLALAFRGILIPPHADTSQEAEDLKYMIDSNLFDVDDKETQSSWIEAYNSAVDSNDLLYGIRAVFGRMTLFRNNAFFFTEHGYLGIGPPLTQAGDKICLLQGSTLPSLLRKVESRWVYVGTCYVHGLSQDEPLQMINADEAQVEDLILE